MRENFTSRASRNVGASWLALCFASGLHIWDEAAHDFLSYFNATALTLYGHFSWFPRIDMQFRTWLAALIVVNVLLLLLTPFAHRNAPWMWPLGFAFAAIEFLDGIGHIAATIRGGTVGSVQFPSVSPGFYSAPLLLLASGYLFWSLRRSRGTPADANKLS